MVTPTVTLAAPIHKRVRQHLATFGVPNYFMIGLQGSQNYGLETENSDIDTKMLVLPTFSDFVKNNEPISTTKIMPNEEHCDVKDIRKYWELLRKQNINFVELIFTNYIIVHPEYEKFWKEIRDNREAIARYNPYRAVKSMKGMSLEKYNALTHRYPSKEAVIDKFGYDPKQLHHIVRLKYFIEDYTEGLPYEFCLRPHRQKELRELKNEGLKDASVEYVKEYAFEALSEINRVADWYCSNTTPGGNPEVDEFLDGILEQILTYHFKKELISR